MKSVLVGLFQLIGDMLLDWPLGTVLGLVLVLVLLCVVAIAASSLGYVLFRLIDSAGLSPRWTPAQVIDKSTNDQSLLLKFDGKEVWLRVTKRLFRLTHPGDQFQLDVVRGRLSGKPCVRGIYK